MAMTPNEIEVLLHFHVSPAPHPRQEAPAVVDATAMMLRNELIERAGRIPDGGVPPTYGAWRTTEKGGALVTMLCETPFPVCQWVDPRTGQAVGPYPAATMHRSNCKMVSDGVCTCGADPSAAPQKGKK